MAHGGSLSLDAVVKLGGVTDLGETGPDKSEKELGT